MYASFNGQDPFGLGAALGSSFGAGAFGAAPVVASAPSAASTGLASTAPGQNALLGIGAVASVAGGVMSTIGAYQQANNSKLQAKSQALAADFQASMAARNARMAELDAQITRDAGRKQLEILGMQYAQIAGQQRVQEAASGTISDGEARASLRLSKRLDALSIRRNTATAVSAALSRATNARNESMAAGVSAQNLRTSARSIRPGLSAFASALEGGSRAVGPLYAYSRT